MKKVFFALLTTIISYGLFGQHIQDEHEHRSNEIGLGIGMVYLISDVDWAPGLHLHYSKGIGEKQKFSLGAAAEYVAGEHQHTALSISLEYELLPSLLLGYGPGVEFPISDSDDHGVHLGHHVELAYEFDFGLFHLGPMVEYGFSKEDQHLMTGLHGGYSF